MQHPHTVVWTALVALLLSVGTPAAGTGALVEQYDEGWIDWTSGIIAAQGVGAPSEKMVDQTQARTTALAAAHRNGWRNVLNTARKVRITATLTAADRADQDGEIKIKLAEMAKAAETTKQEYLSDGTVAVTVQLSLHGGFAQMLLPSDIEQIETIKAVTKNEQNGTTSTAQAAMSNPPSDVYSGLIVDARGLAVRPALAPTIVDENGQEVYGPGIVSREFAVQQGVSGYARGLPAAQENKRIGSNPLTVKVLRLRAQAQTDMVISNADAAKLRSSFEHLEFLKECRVVIVVD